LSGRRANKPGHCQLHPSLSRWRCRMRWLCGCERQAVLGSRQPSKYLKADSNQARCSRWGAVHHGSRVLVAARFHCREEGAIVAGTHHRLRVCRIIDAP
jgi:hypothetical protein